MTAADIVQLVTALGVGGALQALIGFFKDRKRNASDANKTDVDTKLAYLNAVIERLDQEATRVLEENERLQEELSLEQGRSQNLRRRVRELEDEIDGVRRSARDTQSRCEELTIRLKQLVEDTKEDSTE